MYLQVFTFFFYHFVVIYVRKTIRSRQPQKSVTDLEHKVYLDFMLCNLIRLKIANYKTSEFTTTTHFCHMILCFKFGIKICHYYPCF